MGNPHEYLTREPSTRQKLVLLYALHTRLRCEIVYFWRERNYRIFCIHLTSLPPIIVAQVTRANSNGLALLQLQNHTCMYAPTAAISISACRIGLSTAIYREKKPVVEGCGVIETLRES